MEITEERFSEIIRDNEARIRHLCRVYTDRRDEARDLFQEILIQIWQSLPSFEGNAQIDTWIYRLAVNTAISFVRKKKTRKEYYRKYKKEQKSGREGAVAQPADAANEELQALYDAISQLNSSEKAIITMYLEEFSYSEIAFVTDISENYVGVKVHRIKKKLSKIINK